MNTGDFARFDGTALAALIRRGEVSIRDVTEAALAAIAAVDPALNAVVERYDDAFDEKKLGHGPFRGVPFLIKDVGQQFAGRKAESGSRLCEGFVAPANNYYAQNVIAAGFNPIGRSNVPEFSMALCADNKLYGATSNPWKQGYSTSGSSGGAAAAVAAGLVPVAHASDIGGSTRGPAAWCGTVGLHPSRGRVSAGPGTGDPGWGMAQSSVVTRTVRDTAAALELLSKPMPGDPYVVARPERPYTDFLERGKRAIRIGWSAKPLMDAPVDPEIAAAVRLTAETLAANGFIVEEAQPEIDLPAMDEGCKRIWYFGFDDYLDRLGALAGRTVSADTVSRATLRFYEYARHQRADDVLEMLQAFNGMRRAAAQFFMRFDIWLSPTCAQVAQPNGVYGMDVDLPPDEFLRHEQRPCQFLVPYNVWGQPAISLPLAQHTNGLPIGVQLGARHAEEHVLIEVAAVLETLMPWKDRTPPLSVWSLQPSRRSSET